MRAHWSNLLKEFFKPVCAFALLITAAGLVVPSAAQYADLHPQLVHVRAHDVTVREGAKTKTSLQVEVDSGYHINSDHPKLPYLIATKLTLDPDSAVRLVSVNWPAAHDRKFSFSNESLSVFEGSFPVEVLLQAEPRTHGSHVVHGKLRYQACNDQVCRPPSTAPVELRVEVKP